MDVHNSIIANNTGGDCDSGLSSDNGYNIDSDGTCVYETTSQTGDPKLGPLQDNGGPTQTMAISPDSIAFNAGDPNDCQATDQRGETRPSLGGCDVGAYEAQPTPPPVPTPTPSAPTEENEVGGTTSGVLVEAAATVVPTPSPKVHPSAKPFVAPTSAPLGNEDQSNHKPGQPELPLAPLALFTAIPGAAILIRFFFPGAFKK